MISDVLVSFLLKSVRGSVTRPLPVLPVKALDKVRSFNQGDVCIDKECVLGKEVFGKCYLGSAGPLQACAKL